MSYIEVFSVVLGDQHRIYMCKISNKKQKGRIIIMNAKKTLSTPFFDTSFDFLIATLTMKNPKMFYIVVASPQP